jgi:pyoverdine/dityrosine biosynthesis protein Dit1
MLHSIEIDDKSTFEYAISNVNSKLDKIYYIGELNQIFVSNDIEHFDMNQSMKWCDDNWSNRAEYINDIEIEIISCMENYQNIFQYMNQKFAARFYNR